MDVIVNQIYALSYACVHIHVSMTICVCGVCIYFMLHFQNILTFNGF